MESDTPIQASSIYGNKSDMNLICVILTVIKVGRSDIPCQFESNATENVTSLHCYDENTPTKDSVLSAESVIKMVKVRWRMGAWKTAYRPLAKVIKVICPL